MERAQLRRRQARATGQHPRQGRIGEHAAPEHHVAGRRVVAHQALEVGHSKDVPVVGHGKGSTPQRLPVALTTRHPLIAVLLHARVHDQLRKRQAAVQVQDLLVLGIVCKPEPRLDGDEQRRALADIAQEHLELVEMAQEARAFTLGDHGPRGTPQVQVDLGVAAIGEQPRRPHELIGILGHELRHHVETAVVLRIDLPARTAGKIVPHARRRHKGRVVAVERAEALGMHVPKDVPGVSLHGG